MNNLRTQLGKGFLFAYRWSAILVLYSVLAGVLSYMTIVGFYAINSSWVAPVIVSPTNDKILELTGKITTSEQVLASVTVDRDRQTNSLDDMRRSRSELRRLDGQFVSAIRLQNKSNSLDGPELLILNSEKHINNQNTAALTSQLDLIDHTVNSNLTAGLITKIDASTIKTTIARTKSDAIDGKIAEVLLRDSIRQKTSEDLATVSSLSKEVELKTEIVQLDILIKTGEAQLKSDIDQISNLQKALALAKSSPYYLATASKVQFAFVPYDNQTNAISGAPIFNCYLNAIVCRQVGTVGQVFKDEEVGTHPIFRTEIRGFMIQLNLRVNEAAKSKTLFLGRKPLLF